MKRPVAIGIQDFAKLREEHCFYIDKTSFIREWWESKDDVTLIARPRRFGKTITMSMLNYFFSNKYAGRGDLFEGLDIWKEEKYRELQGTYPVIFLTFAGIKGTSYADTITQIKKQLVYLFMQYADVGRADCLEEKEKDAWNRISEDMRDVDAAYALNLLSRLLEKYYGKKVLIFLDEYDTPMQEAYLSGYWEELTTFIRTMFNNTFKTNSSLGRAIMTGITRVSKESIFSDLNNLNVITTTSAEYAASFGFTEREVFDAMDEMGMSEESKKEVKRWYDGFTFGNVTDIYNPWSITNYLKEQKFDTYWSNTSGNGLVGRLIQTGDSDLKMQFESLMQGAQIEAQIDEQIVFNQLDDEPDAIWSLLLASGYLKCLKVIPQTDDLPLYQLALTNLEVKLMFLKLIRGWFKKSRGLNKFVSAMFKGDTKSMNYYMNDVALHTFSYFDTGKQPSKDAPERFYHGFVLGLLVENASDYIITSNRESGLGRHDVVLEPRDQTQPAVIMEFKVYDGEEESTLSDTAAEALKQIEEQKYDADLLYRGIPEQNIFKYGIAFRGQECLIQKA